MTTREAWELVGGLGKPSKMPGRSYGLPVSACGRGRLLSKDPRTPCGHCYAADGFYRANDRCGLTKPAREGWTHCLDGGWTCNVSQRAYGHPARKQTWLYAFGVEPPVLDWSRPAPIAVVSWLTRHGPVMPRLSKRAAKATPAAFRDVLIAIARSGTPRQVAA